MDNVKLIVLGMAAGLKDSVFGIRAVIQLLASSSAPGRTSSGDAAMNTTSTSNAKEEPSVGYRLWQCCLMNGGVCLSGIAVFYYLILPGLWSLLTLLFGSSSGMPSVLWSWIRPILVGLFGVVYVLPLFSLSRIVNALWFQDIANSSYRQLRGRPQSLPKISKVMADLLFSTGFEFLFLLQSMLVGLLPIPLVKDLFSLLHLSLLYGLYVFEYKWYNMGWELHKRLSFIENNWPYFAGFGLPLAMLTTFSSSYIVSACMVSLVFPLFIISGNKATPMTSPSYYHMPLFSPVVWVCNVILHWMVDPRARGLYAARRTQQQQGMTPKGALHSVLGKRREPSAHRETRTRCESSDQRSKREAIEQHEKMRTRRELNEQHVTRKLQKSTTGYR